tara:strand:+ start:749 stop:1483 length:735 start_codon:yes stop_codon:yes gene_type:complete
MILLLSIAVIGSWEWSKLSKFTLPGSISYLIFTALIGGELLFILSRVTIINPYTNQFIWIYAAALCFWLFCVPYFLRFNLSIKNPLLYAIIGWMLLLPTCLALFQLRAIDPMLLLGFITAIWLADTAAFFTGRKFGKHKLAPIISPGKTWEGVFGALATVCIYALIWDYLVIDKIKTSLYIPLLLGLAVLSILGDLFESLIKRQAKVKNSGNILPGHGGILDRIDALTSTLPVAIFVVLIFFTV